MLSHDVAPLSRRTFVQSTGVAAAIAASAAATQFTHAQTNSDVSAPLIQPGCTILFQGDSITDAGRSREAAAEPNSQPALGNGYAWLAASQLLVDRAADDLKIFNRGISGNKVHQLAERWDAECLDLKPNVLSILIGVNDFWHKHNGNYDGTLETYENDYNALIERTKSALPDVKLVLCEPFVLRVGAVDDSWFPEFDGYRAAARRVAEQAGAVFVPFQEMFDAAVKIAPPARWAADGVHPAPDGAALMAHAWLNAVGA
jgi:lysophospholipase L1-like esterase